jgi:hypothetical protein
MMEQDKLDGESDIGENHDELNVKVIPLAHTKDHEQAENFFALLEQLGMNLLIC